MRRAHMLEHSDRNDPVEGTAQRSIIDQLEADVIGHTGFLGPAAGDLQLLFRQGNSGDVDPGDLVQVDGHATPTAADVE